MTQNPQWPVIKEIPKRIQLALNNAKIKADSGYFSNGKEFTAWCDERVVAVLKYNKQTKIWEIIK